ncbi:hypothetical protein Esti_004096 [Eimeria stiedai]
MLEGALVLLLARKAPGLPEGLPAASAAAGPLAGGPPSSSLPALRFFSTRRKTAKAIADLHLQQRARREFFKRRQGGRGGLVIAAAATAASPKYHANPQALLLPPPSAPALFDKVCVASTPATRRSPPPELLHGPPQRPLGRVSSLKSAELAAAVLRSARDHRNNGRLWRELGAACARRAPHLAAAEAAFVLHGFAAAGCRAVPVLQSCAKTLLLKWPEARLLDAARALHALVVVFGVRETRLLLRCMDSFGPLLLQQGDSGRIKFCCSTLSPLQSLQQLQALSLLLKTFAEVQLPYHPLLLTAAETLQVHLEQALPRQPKQRRLSSSSSRASLRGSCMQQQQIIFALPPLAAAKEGHGGDTAWRQQEQQQQEQQRVTQRLPGPLVLSLLQSLSRLGVRHEPLLRALDAFLAANLLPPAKTHKSHPAAAAAAAASVHPAASLASSAGSGRGPSHVCSKSGWLHRGAPGGPLHAAALRQAGGGVSTTGGPPGVPWWSLGELSLAVQAVSAVGGGRSQLVAAWVHALRQSVSRCHEAADLALALHAARLSSFFCRPLLLQLLGCLTRRVAEVSLPVEPQALLAAAAAAARLPAAAPAAFWSAVDRCLLGLHAQGADAAGFFTSAHSTAACASSNSPKGCMQETLETCHAEAALKKRGAPHPRERRGPPEAPRVELLADAVEALALAAPALPLDHTGPLLTAALRKLHFQGSTLSLSLRLLSMVKLIELKATSAGPAFALCSPTNNNCSSGSSSSSTDSSSSSGSRARESVDLAFVRESWEAAMGIVHLQAEPLLRQQETEASARGGESVVLESQAAAAAAAAAWRPLVEGPLAPGIGHLQELCVLGVLNQEGLTRSSSSSSKLAGLRRHVRCLLRRRRSSCPLVFVSVAEAAAALLLEVGPFVGEAAGLGLGAALELLPRRRQLGAPAVQQQGNPWATQAAQRLGSDPRGPSSLQETPEVEDGGPAFEIADAEALELILCCLSSRIVTAPTPLVMLAARSTATALMHPRWLAALQHQQQQQQQQQKQQQQQQQQQQRQQQRSCELEDLASKSPCGLRQQVQQVHEGKTCGDEEKVAELLAAICLISLETLQQRLHALHANELALLAVDMQSLLSSLSALPGLGPPAAAPPALLARGQQQAFVGRLRGPPQQSECSGFLGFEAVDEGSTHSQQQQQQGGGSTSSLMVLASQLETLLEEVAQRWRSSPATIAKAGPASSLNVWLRLGGGGPLIGVPPGRGSGMDGGAPAGVLRLYHVFDEGRVSANAETIRQRIYSTAVLEALCPGASSTREMARVPHSRRVQGAAGAPAQQQGAAPQRTSAPKFFSSAHQLRGEEVPPPVAQTAKMHGAGEGGCCFDEERQHGLICFSAKRQQWLENVEGLRREEAAGAGSHSRGAAGGLLRMQQHHDLAITWLSQVTFVTGLLSRHMRFINRVSNGCLRGPDRKPKAVQKGE